MREDISDNIWFLILAVIIISYSAFLGLKDCWKETLSWGLIIESFAVFFAWNFAMERLRLFCRINGVLQLFMLNRGNAPFSEAFTAFVLVVVEVMQLFKGITLYRTIFLLYGILMLWIRYDTVPYLINRFRGIYDCYPPERNTVIPPDAGAETVAVVTDCGTEGKVVDSDMILHYWIYRYEYRVPGKDKIKKHFDIISFLGSGWGSWFEKYNVGFRFPIRYNRYCPKEHIRLHNFD